MSKRQDIISAVDARLKAILISGGYITNIGQNVKEWYQVPVDAAVNDLLSYEDPTCKRIDPPDEEDDNAAAYDYKRLTVNIFVITSGSTAPAKLRIYIADVLKAVGSDVTWGGLALNTTLDGDDSEVVHEKKKLGGTQITIYIDYKVVQWED